VANELETFLATLSARERVVPRFVEQELRAYLDCGILSNGFMRVWCEDCQTDKLVALWCKGRSVCPSCTGRRMCESAAFLVDRVLPLARTRQWVLSLPIALRYRLAYDPPTRSAVLGVYARALQGWARDKARDVSGQRVKWASGAVTFVQRAGSALNLNVHFHTLAPDTAWWMDDDGKVHRVDLPPPTDDEVAKLLKTIVQRIARCLRRRGILDEAGWVRANTHDDPHFVLDEAAAASVRGMVATGERAGHAVEKFGGQGANDRRPKWRGRRCAERDGFSLHANVAIDAGDRTRLEKLCRYVARGPVANSRLKRLDDGRYSYELKSRWRDGTTHIVLTGHELMEKLCALVPRPRTHRTRYHGVFAAASKLRKFVVREAVERAAAKLVREGVATQPSHAAKWLCAKKRFEWAELMKRVWDVDVLQCDRCGGRLKVLAAITMPVVIDAMLRALNIEMAVPPVARARPPPWDEDAQLEFEVA